MARSSKDLAKRLQFRHAPRGDVFRRYYPWAVLVAVAVAIGSWFFASTLLGPRQYMPRPVSSVHATFSDRCENCHDSFQVVQDARCLQCHAVRVHSEHEDHTPRCSSCHIEHREDRPLTQVASGACVDCHGELVSRRPGGAAIAANIGSFADHPELSPRREGATDPTRLRFNHKLHLTSAEISKPLECANCHQPKEDGRYMTTAAFERYASRAGEEASVWPAGGDEVGEDKNENIGAPPRMIYCRKCHTQNVTRRTKREGEDEERELPSPFSEIEAPHTQPQAIHVSLVHDVLALGVERAKTIFESDQVRLPGRVPRLAVDSESDTWAEFQDLWVGAIEAALYQPLRAAPAGASLYGNNKNCFLCHEQGDAAGNPAAVSIATTAIPSRWIPHGEFAHRAHEKMKCAECHGDLKQSADTADVNLPRREVCEKCHRADAGRSAGAECVLCHQYHDTSKDPLKRRALQKEVAIEVLTGEMPSD